MDGATILTFLILFILMIVMYALNVKGNREWASYVGISSASAGLIITSIVAFD
jgi:Ca2+/Na+ antiporter